MDIMYFFKHRFTTSLAKTKYPISHFLSWIMHPTNYLGALSKREVSQASVSFLSTISKSLPATEDLLLVESSDSD